MKNAVRYFSKSGHTKAIADAIAKGAGVEAISVTDEPQLKEEVDILFLGGAPYANILAPQLKAYVNALTSDKVKKVVVFGTSNWSLRTIKALKKICEEKGIPVEKEHFHASAKDFRDQLGNAAAFGKKYTIEA